ncbi:MAG: endonuclease IV, partial [Lachnospiraceae bacterium]|nr:endonuclease IV [Lachnospiraceae bacterium]
MLHIGCHLSTSKGFRNMGETALSIGADTFAFFTRNPRGGSAKEIREDDVNGLRDII